MDGKTAIEIAIRARDQSGGGFRSAKAKAKGFDDALKGINDRLSKMLGIDTSRFLNKATIGFTAAGYAAQRFGRELLRTTIQYDSYLFTLRAVTGDQEMAGQQMQWLVGIALKYGVAVSALAKDYGRWYAAASELGLNLHEIQELYEGIAAASAVYNLSAADTSLVVSAFTQIANKGVVSMEELRRQLGERMPGALNIAARAMGLTTGVLIDLVSAGELSSRVFLQAIGSEFTRTFADSALTAAERLQGRIYNLGTTWELFLVSFDKTFYFSKLAAGGIDILTEALTMLREEQDKAVRRREAVARAIVGVYEDVVNSPAFKLYARFSETSFGGWVTDRLSALGSAGAMGAIGALALAERGGEPEVELTRGQIMARDAGRLHYLMVLEEEEKIQKLQREKIAYGDRYELQLGRIDEVLRRGGLSELARNALLKERQALIDEYFPKVEREMTVVDRIAEADKQRMEAIASIRTALEGEVSNANLRIALEMRLNELLKEQKSLRQGPGIPTPAGIGEVNARLGDVRYAETAVTNLQNYQRGFDPSSAEYQIAGQMIERFQEQAMIAVEEPNIFNDFSNRLRANLTQALLSGNFDRIGDALVTSLNAVLLDKLFEGLFEQLGNSALGGFFGGLFKAQGGPVYGGRGYIVGERGPELFVPQTSGTVIPNNRIGGMGGASVVVNMNNNYTGLSYEEALAVGERQAEVTKAEIVSALGQGRIGVYGNR